MKTERENTKSYDINHENKHFGIKKSSEKKKANRSLLTKNVNKDCIWEGSDLFLFEYLLNSLFKSSISLQWGKNNLKSKE